VVPAVATALTGGAGTVSAAVSPELAQRTVATVFDFLTGGPAAACSPPVVLAKGVATTMITKKIMTLMVAATIGLVGLGVVFAGDDPPNASPTPVPARGPMPAALGRPVPVQPPVMPAGAPLEIDWKRDEDQVRDLLAVLRRGAPPKAAQRDQQPGKPIVFIQALCVRVPAGFCERSGLTAEESAASGAWFLTRREQRMFSSLLRAEPGTDIVTRPQLQVEEGRTGHFQIGQSVSADGKTVDGPGALKFVDVGVQLKITPRTAANGQLLLRIETESTEMAESKVNLGGDPPVYAPAFNTESHQATVVVPDAGTVVLRSATPAAAGKKAAQETLWVLTPHVVRTDKKAVTPAGPAPKPSPVMPPAAPTPPMRP
jgi:hypothetical protein